MNKTVLIGLLSMLLLFIGVILLDSWEIDDVIIDDGNQMKLDLELRGEVTEIRRFAGDARVHCRALAVESVASDHYVLMLVQKGRQAENRWSYPRFVSVMDIGGTDTWHGPIRKYNRFPTDEDISGFIDWAEHYWTVVPDNGQDSATHEWHSRFL